MQMESMKRIQSLANSRLSLDSTSCSPISTIREMIQPRASLKSKCGNTTHSLSIRLQDSLTFPTLNLSGARSISPRKLRKNVSQTRSKTSPLCQERRSDTDLSTFYLKTTTCH